MCITLPTKVISTAGDRARVAIAGQQKDVYIAVDDLKQGDWILVYAGAAISVIPENEALEILHYLNLLEEPSHTKA